MTDYIGETLNDDYFYQSYIIDFAFYNKKYDCNGLRNYLTKRLNYNDDNAYVMTGNGVLTALVNLSKINTKNELHNKIVNYFNNVEKKPRTTYKLKVLCCEDLNYEPYNPFDYWFSTSIYLIEKRGEKWSYNFYMIHYDNDFVNRLYNAKYPDRFRSSETHLDIQKYMQNKKQTKIEKEKHTEKMKIIKNELFIKKVEKHFSFTNGYLSKKVVCDLLHLDHKCKGDIKRLNNILTEYGVEYDKLKMIKGDRGVFLNISLK